MKWTFCALLAAVGGAFAFGSATLAADDEKPQPPRLLAPMSRDVERLVKQYYPDAKVSLTYDKKTDTETLHFEFSCYPILMRYRNKDGSWQEPAEVRGPYVGGVWCDMKLGKGRYSGDADAVENAEKGVTEMGPDFYTRLVTPYSEKLDKSLTVNLRFPGGTPPEFMRKFDDLAKRFDQYLTKPAEK
jgi:hypothetical protein